MAMKWVQQEGPGHEDQVSGGDLSLLFLPTRESEMVDLFLGASHKDEVLKIMLMEKQIRAGQWTGFKAFVAPGDCSSMLVWV